MRRLIFALSLLLAAPALAQTPAPETITFEGVGTPMAYEPDAKVPSSARLKEVSLAGGGKVKFRTRGGAKYAALVTHLGTTAIVGASKKGKLQPLRYVDMRIRKSPGARFDSFTAIPAGARVDTKDTTDTSDDEVVYDNPGAGQFILYDTRKNVYPVGGAQFVIGRTEAAPYDLTTTSIDFARILIFGELVYDDLVVSFGH